MSKRTQTSIRGWVEPMLATLTAEHFSDPAWIFEPKLDGVRCLSFKRGTAVRMFSRNKLPLHDGHPDIRQALERIPHDFVIDGEIAATVDGRTSFGAMQQRRHMTPAEQRRVTIHYHVFDLMRLDGVDVRELPVLERKELLRKVGFAGGPMKLVPHRRRYGERYLQEACAKGMEGIIAKRIDSTYVGGRSRDWLKFKCSLEQEFVVGGWTDPKGSRAGFGALLVGYFQGRELRYAGKVGTGYGSGTLDELARMLAPLEVGSPPFADAPRARTGVHWTRPELVVQVAFSEWTHDGRLRHPRYVGLRRDKAATDVIREG